MRKVFKPLTIALIVSASVPAFAQSQGAITVKDGNGSLQSLCNVASATGSVEVPCSNLYVQGAQVGSGNPVPAAITGSLPAFAATPTVNIGTAPSLTVGTLPALPTGSNTIGAVTISGTPTFNCGTGCGGGSGGAVTQSGTWNVGLSAGTNAIGSITNTGFGITGTLPAFAATPTVNIGTAPTMAVTGAFWQATQPVSVASLPLPVGAAAGVAQASVTSGLTGTLVQGAVTTSAPSYTSAQTNPLSLTTVGALRGDITSVGGTALAAATSAYGTAPTGTTVMGVNAAVTNTVAQNLTQIGGSAVNAASAQLGANIASVGGTAAAAGVPNGSAGKALAVAVGTAVPNTDQSGTAFAGSGSVNGTVVASTTGGGAVISGEINVTALTLGTATSVLFTLQESRSNNFTDIWVSDPITATGVVPVPAIPVGGKRRWRAFSVGGTSTTVTATITSLELPAGGYPVNHQMRDVFAATNPFALMYNSAAMTASNFVLGTPSTATTPFYIESTKQITAFMTLAGSPTVTTQPVVTMQLSMDGANFWSIPGATLTAAGNGTYATTYTGTAKFARLIVTTAAAYSAGSYTISNIGVNAVN